MHTVVTHTEDMIGLDLPMHTVVTRTEDMIGLDLPMLAGAVRSVVG